MAVPYDVVNDALNSARMRINDAFATIVATSGKVLQTEEAFTQTATNNGWRAMQKMLVSLGWSKLKNDTSFTLTACTQPDPLVQVYLDWSGYFNGSTNNPAVNLPSDFIQPDDCWERQDGAVIATMYTMDRILNGMPRIPKGNYNKLWEWRNDRLYMPGANVTTQLLVRYTALIADFLNDAPVTNTPWYMQALPIVQGADCLSYFIALEFCKAREIAGDDPAGFQSLATQACKYIAERDTNRPMAAGKVSEYSRMQDKWSPVPAIKPGQQRE